MEHILISSFIQEIIIHYFESSQIISNQHNIEEIMNEIIMREIEK